MCVFQKPKKPDFPQLPPPATTSEPPKQSSTSTNTAINDAKTKNKARVNRAQGRNKTIVTGPLGLSEEPNLRQKTLLGD